MKSLQQSINESTQLNESILTVAGGIIAGIIGYKLIKSLLKGLIMFVGLKTASKELEKLENAQNKMTSILEKYPESQNEIKIKFENILNSKGGKTDSFKLYDLFINENDKVFNTWSSEDKTSFIKLWSEVIDIQQNALASYSNDTLKLINKIK